MKRVALLVAVTAVGAFGQSKTLSQGPNRMEIKVERREGGAWRLVDPNLVFEQNDRVRFRFRTNFEGWLYVLNHSTSGKYEQLFPHEETGNDNRVLAGKEYVVPATAAAFRIAGPPGHEILYWMVAPARLIGKGIEYRPLPAPPPPDRQSPANMTPRCDDAMLRARGDCIDTSAGPRTAHSAPLPENLAAIGRDTRDLVIMRQQNTAVVASPVPLSGPVIYEFHLAHK